MFYFAIVHFPFSHLPLVYHHPFNSQFQSSVSTDLFPDANASCRLAVSSEKGLAASVSGLP
ncbi:hypothetical protein Bca4012_049486 [Brassica carinata]